MAERVTIVVEPSAERGGFLIIQDAMRQVLDFIEVVTAAASDDARPKFAWRLVSASATSPFTTVAEAVSIDPEWPDIDQDALEAKSRASAALKSILKSGELPEWADEDHRERFRALLFRNVNGIAKTTLQLERSAPPIVIVERRARAALESIEQRKAKESAQLPDWSGEELGSVEGSVVDTTTHYGQPAIKIRHRVSGEKITCVFSPERAAQIGNEHVWKEVWQGQRIVVVGKIKRKRDGSISLVTVDEVRPIKSVEFNLDSVIDPNFTNGEPVRRYLDDLWGE